MRSDYSKLFATRPIRRGPIFMKKQTKQFFPEQICVTSVKHGKHVYLDATVDEKNISSRNHGKKIGIYKLIGYKKLVATKKLV